MVYWEHATKGDLQLLKLIKFILEGHEDLVDFLFNSTRPELRDSSFKLLNEAHSFSSGELILIQVALDLWDGSGNARFEDVIKGIDYQTCDKIFKAASILQGANF